MADTKTTGLTEVTTPADADLLFIVDGPTISKKITWANVKAAMGADGWLPVSVSWTYASASTINVPSGAASIYSVGDKIKLTQTTVKYFYVVGVADTVLTVTGGSDYTVANAAITLPNYSKAATPVGFPGKFNYVPTVTSQTGAITSYTVNSAVFSITGAGVFINVNTTLTDAGTGGGVLFITNPITVANGVGVAINGANGKLCLAYVAAGSSIIVAEYDNTSIIATGVIINPSIWVTLP